MKVQTSRFGEIEVDEASILTFPCGIIGFPDFTRCVLLDHNHEAPFRWLQSLDHNALAFIVMDSVMVKPDYRVAIPSSEVRELGEGTSEDFSVLLILTVPSPDPARITANLKGPIVINRQTRRGKQIVLTEDHPTRYPLFPANAQQPRPSERPLPVGAGDR